MVSLISLFAIFFFAIITFAIFSLYSSPTILTLLPSCRCAFVSRRDQTGFTIYTRQRITTSARPISSDITVSSFTMHFSVGFETFRSEYFRYWTRLVDRRSKKYFRLWTKRKAYCFQVDVVCLCTRLRLKGICSEFSNSDHKHRTDGFQQRIIGWMSLAGVFKRWSFEVFLTTSEHRKNRQKRKRERLRETSIFDGFSLQIRYFRSNSET